VDKQSLPYVVTIQSQRALDAQKVLVLADIMLNGAVASVNLEDVAVAFEWFRVQFTDYLHESVELVESQEERHELWQMIDNSEHWLKFLRNALHEASAEARAEA